jgi:hypothetical protein
MGTRVKSKLSNKLMSKAANPLEINSYNQTVVKYEFVNCNFLPHHWYYNQYKKLKA